MKIELLKVDLFLLLMGTGCPLVPANPLSMGLDQILNLSRVISLFVDKIHIRGHERRMAKPNAFERIAILHGYTQFRGGETVD